MTREARFGVHIADPPRVRAHEDKRARDELIRRYSDRAALWQHLVDRATPLWDIPGDPFNYQAWVNPFLPLRVYNVPPIPDEARVPTLRPGYTPDDALPVDLLRYRADEAHSARV
jgi:hypothetical protein